MMNPFFKEAPSDTQMFRCPACKEIVSVGNTSCQHCGVPIDEATARRLNAKFREVTDAVASANTFKQSIWLAVILAIASPIYVIGVRPYSPRLLLVSVAPIGFVGYVISWRRKYGALETLDEDYPDAVRAMRRSFLVWVTALLIQAVVVGYAISSSASNYR
jgi:hypothetical protein